MTPAEPSSVNAQQIANWNTAAGKTWVEFQHQLDAQIVALGARALAVLDVRPGECALDVGCGCGQTSVELGALVGTGGRVIGLDVSAPMLAVARDRAARAGMGHVEFRLGDAQVDKLPVAVADALYSRFGVMFFNDPVAAFRNLRSALTTDGRIAFVCWRELAANPWMRVQMEAASSMLPAMPAGDPLAPGPYAFADPARIIGILTQAGFRDVSVEPYDALIGAGDLQATTRLSLRVGPLGAVLREHPEFIADVEGAVRGALARYDTPTGVRMPAAVWIVQARNSASR